MTKAVIMTAPPRDVGARPSGARHPPWPDGDAAGSEQTTGRGAARAAAERTAMTRAVCAALATLPAGSRPLLLTASGTDDLQPDPDGVLTDDSPLRTRPRGFGFIGIPVRRTIEAAARETG